MQGNIKSEEMLRHGFGPGSLQILFKCANHYAIEPMVSKLTYVNKFLIEISNAQGVCVLRCKSSFSKILRLMCYLLLYREYIINNLSSNIVFVGCRLFGG